MPAPKIFIATFTCLFVFCISLIDLNAAEITAWRVDGKLISKGDTKSRVLAIAGDPDLKETIQEAVDVGLSNGNKSDPQKIELWHYIFKNRELIYKLYFVDGEISKIIWERI